MIDSVNASISPRVCGEHHTSAAWFLKEKQVHIDGLAHSKAHVDSSETYKWSTGGQTERWTACTLRTFRIVFGRAVERTVAQLEAKYLCTEWNHLQNPLFISPNILR